MVAVRCAGPWALQACRTAIRFGSRAARRTVGSGRGPGPARFAPPMREGGTEPASTPGGTVPDLSCSCPDDRCDSLATAGSHAHQGRLHGGLGTPGRPVSWRRRRDSRAFACAASRCQSPSVSTLTGLTSLRQHSQASDAGGDDESGPFPCPGIAGPDSFTLRVNEALFAH